MFDIHAKSSGSISHKISTERSITYIAGSINKVHMATRTITALSLPILTRRIFWTHRKGQKVSSAPSFPIWLASMPRLKIRRELASVLTLVGRYTLLFPILTKWIEFLYRFCICSGMWPRVDLVKPSSNSLTYRVTISGRRRTQAGSTLSSTLMDRQLSQGSVFSATSTSFFKSLLNQCLNLSLVS